MKECADPIQAFSLVYGFQFLDRKNAIANTREGFCSFLIARDEHILRQCHGDREGPATCGTGLLLA